MRDSDSDVGRRRFLGIVASILASVTPGCSRSDDANSVDGGSKRGENRARGGSEKASDRKSDGIQRSMVRIEGGEYTIGVDDGPEAAQPAHTVEIEPFLIDRYEVTNSEFVEFLNSLNVEPRGRAPPGSVTEENLPDSQEKRFLEGPEGSEESPLAALDDENSRIGVSDDGFFVQEGFEKHPANEVTWYGAREFADWRGARLLTEAEWEAAARGFEGRRYPWGNSEPTPEKCVYGRGSGETAEVGSHPKGATPDGVHDMSGNVSEWTSSLFRLYPYDAGDGREDPEVRGERVTRGGAHVFFGPEELTTYQRTGFSREFDRGHRHIGFRCGRSIEEGN